MSSQPLFVLPGEAIPTERIPTSHKKKLLKVGPGLQHTPPSTMTATLAGTVHTDARKPAIWLNPSSPRGRYVAHPGDLVVGTVERSMGDVYAVSLTAHAPPAALPHLAFEGATRKTRPQLAAGALVYARVAAAPAQRPDAVELECAALGGGGAASSSVSAAGTAGGVGGGGGGSGKADGLGPLRGGALARVGGSGARWIAAGRRGGCVVLEELGRRLAFEVAVGRNGLVWVGSSAAASRGGGAGGGGGGEPDEGETAEVLAVVRVLTEVGNKVGMAEVEQRELVERVLKGLSL